MLHVQLSAPEGCFHIHLQNEGSLSVLALHLRFKVRT